MKKTINCIKSFNFNGDLFLFCNFKAVFKTALIFARNKNGVKLIVKNPNLNTFYRHSGMSKILFSYGFFIYRIKNYGYLLTKTNLCFKI